MTEPPDNQIVPVPERDLREQEVRYGPPASAPAPAEAAPQVVYVSRSRGGCTYIAAGMAGCLFLLGVALAVLIVTGALSVNSLLNSLQPGNILGSVAQFAGTANPPPRAEIDQSPAILVGIQPLGQLVSISSEMAQSDIDVNISQGALNACGYSASHVAQGAIEAGIDLTQVTLDDIAYNEATNTYTVTLPYPRLTSCRVDYIRQYDRSFTTCNIDWDEARVLAGYSALSSFRDRALEGGILERAASEARLVLGNFIQIVSGANVEIVFAPPPQEPALPASCIPIAPPGWVYDPATGRWDRSG